MTTWPPFEQRSARDLHMVFSGFGRERVAKAASELAEHLSIIENIRALQQAQRELAEVLKAQGERLTALEMDMRVLKAETKFEALKETQALVNAVQGGLNDRIEALSNRVAVIDAAAPKRLR